MKFNMLAWSALCFFYRSVGDRKYINAMSDSEFLDKLRNSPSSVGIREFEDKVILNQINVINYDLLIKHNLASEIISAIVDLEPDWSAFKNMSILDCDLADESLSKKMSGLYMTLCSVPGLWSTGTSKILHILNDRLFAVFDPQIASKFGISPRQCQLGPFLSALQKEAREAVADFEQQGYEGSPEVFLSEKLGYTRQGCQKSLVKFIDEYYRLRLGDGLPVPPDWIPASLNGMDADRALIG